jgi:hypothetical protein
VPLHIEKETGSLRSGTFCVGSGIVEAGIQDSPTPEAVSLSHNTLCCLGTGSLAGDHRVSACSGAGTCLLN